MKPIPAAVIALLFLIVVAASAIYNLQPPGVVPATAPDSVFSADRAMGYIRHIAAAPHPIGTPAEAKVREYIVGQLRAMGIRPTLDSTTVTGMFHGIHYAAFVVNIVARLPGTANSKAVVLMAHYDSVPTGPGASDDGSGVATILETLHALKSSPPLRNDVIAIFTDGEEEGMLGSQAIAENESLVKKIGIVLNFEARGNSGPVLMFETSENNGTLIQDLAQNVPDAVATSVAYDLYKRSPNNTDFTRLKTKGIAGYNFAFIGDADRYHSELDNYANVDPRSLQHDGAYALALTRYYGDRILPPAAEVNDVYFNFLWPHFVYYPVSLVTPLTAATLIIFLLMIYAGIRNEVIKLGKSIVGIFLLGIPLAVFCTGTFFLWEFLQGYFPEASRFIYGYFYNTGFVLSGIIVFAAAATATWYVYLRKFFRSSEMATGALVWWLIFLILSARYAPEASYVAEWPLLLSSLALLLFFVVKKADFRSPLIFGVLLICAIPGVYLATQLSHLLYLNGLLPEMAAVVVGLSILTIGTLLPHLAIITSPNKWILPAVLFLIGLALFSDGFFTHDFNVKHPEPDSMVYAVDLDNTSAYWMSFDDRSDEWTRLFIKDTADIEDMHGTEAADFFPGTGQPLVVANASVVDMSADSIAVESDSSGGGYSHLRLLIPSPSNGYLIKLYANMLTRIISPDVNGRPVPSVAVESHENAKWILYCFGRPRSDWKLSLNIPHPDTLRLTEISVAPGLPSPGGLSLPPRPGSLMPRPFVETDVSLVKKTYRILPR